MNKNVNKDNLEKKDEVNKYNDLSQQADPSKNSNVNFNYSWW